MDGSVERLLQGLEARFEALLARDEEEAADDLATSLDRGRALHERLLSAGSALRLVLPDGVRSPVSVIGDGYLGCGSPLDCLAPTEASVILLEAGAPPETTGLTISQALRPWAESRRRVTVSLCEATASYVGRATLVASDHLILESSGGTRLVIPLERIGSIRLSPED